MVIDKTKGIGTLLGLDMEAALPYQRKEDGLYDTEEILRDIVAASAGTDTDLTGILEVEKLDGISPYERIAELGGILWPAPSYESAQNGGIKRHFMVQEGEWADRPYGYFRTPDGEVHMILVRQGCTGCSELTQELMRFGTEEGFYTIDYQDPIVKARDMGLTPDHPDQDYRGMAREAVPADKYPYWFGLGVVYEHFHTAKSNRSPRAPASAPKGRIDDCNPGPPLIVKPT